MSISNREEYSDALRALKFYESKYEEKPNSYGSNFYQRAIESVKKEIEEFDVSKSNEKVLFSIEGKVDMSFSDTSFIAKKMSELNYFNNEKPLKVESNGLIKYIYPNSIRVKRQAPVVEYEGKEIIKSASDNNFFMIEISHVFLDIPVTAKDIEDFDNFTNRNSESTLMDAIDLREYVISQFLIND